MIGSRSFGSGSHWLFEPEEKKVYRQHGGRQYHREQNGR